MDLGGFSLNGKPLERFRCFPRLSLCSFFRLFCSFRQAIMG